MFWVSVQAGFARAAGQPLEKPELLDAVLIAEARDALVGDPGGPGEVAAEVSLKASGDAALVRRGALKFAAT